MLSIFSRAYVCICAYSLSAKYKSFITLICIKISQVLSFYKNRPLFGSNFLKNGLKYSFFPFFFPSFSLRRWRLPSPLSCVPSPLPAHSSSHPRLDSSEAALQSLFFFFSASPPLPL